MDLLVIVLAAALGTALGGGLALLAQRMGRSGGLETELHLLRDRLATSEAELQAAQASLAETQKASDDRVRMLDRQTSDLRTLQDRIAGLESDIERNVERRQAAERRVDELVLERERGPVPPLESGTEMIRLHEQLEAEMRKSQALEAEIARRDEERGNFVVNAAEPAEVEHLRAELEAERERVTELLGEIGTLLSQSAAAQAPPPADPALAQMGQQIERLQAELAEERRLRANAEQAALEQAAAAAAPAPVDDDAAERLRAEVARLSSALVEEKRLYEDAFARLEASIENEDARARHWSAEVDRLNQGLVETRQAYESEAVRAQQATAEIARLNAALLESHQAFQAEAERHQQAAADIARLSAELAGRTEMLEAESARSRQLSGEIAQWRSQVESGQAGEAELVRRLSDEIARLSALAVEERSLREMAAADRGALEAQLAQHSAAAGDAEQTRAALAERVAALAAEVQDQSRQREEMSSQLAVVEVQLSQERNRAAALEAERTRLLAQVEEERRVAARSKELLTLAQDRMASVFAVFSGEAPKANGHHVAAPQESADAKPESETVPVV